MKALVALLMVCTACGARSALSTPLDDDGGGSSSNTGTGGNGDCSWVVDGPPIAMTSTFQARFADSAPSLVAFPRDVAMVFLRTTSGLPQLVRTQLAPWDGWPPSVPEPSLLVQDSCAPRVTQSVDGTFAALVALGDNGACAGASRLYAPITEDIAPSRPVHVAPTHFPAAAARGSASDVLVLSDVVADEVVVRVVDGAGIILGERELGCASGLTPVAATSAGDRFYVVMGSDAPWLSCAVDGLYRVFLAQVDAASAGVQLLAEWSVADRLLSLAIAVDNSQLWCAWQDYGTNAEAPPPVQLARSVFDGSSTTPANLDWTSDFHTSIALMALGNDQVVVGRLTGFENASMAVDVLDRDSQRLAEAIFSTVTFVPGTPWLSLAPSPDRRALLAAWDGYAVSEGSRAYVGRIACAEPGAGRD